MSKSNPHAAGYLRLVYQNVSLAGIAAALGTPGDVTFNLHTAAPGAAGSPLSNVATYTGYLAQTLTRNTTNFVVTEGPLSGDAAEVSNGAVITFPDNTGADQDITHVSASINGVIIHAYRLTTDGAPLAADLSNAATVTVGVNNTPIRFEIGGWSVREN